MEYEDGIYPSESDAMMIDDVAILYVDHLGMIQMEGARRGSFIVPLKGYRKVRDLEVAISFRPCKEGFCGSIWTVDTQGIGFSFLVLRAGKPYVYGVALEGKYLGPMNEDEEEALDALNERRG